MRFRLPVRPPGRGPRLWLMLGTVAVAATAITTIAYANQSAPVTNTSTTTPVQRGVVELTSSAAGTVQATQSRGLSFSTGGVVTELDVKAGDPVTADQVLARIDSTSVQDEVNSAQASVNSAVDALARAQQTASPQASNCQPAPVAYVIADSAGASASASPSPTASASASASPSHPAQPGGTPTEPGRTPTQPGAKPSQPGGAAGSAGRAGAGAGGCGSSSGSSGSSGGRSGGGSGDSLMSAEQQLTNAQLALQLAQDKLAGTTITAPVAGRVLSVAGTVGAQQTPGSSAFIVLGSVADTAVKAGFSEADVPHLAVGQTATITLPNRGGAQVKGKVSQIDPAGTTSGRLVRYGVVVAFDEVPPDLLLGQSANVAVLTSSVSDVLYVPSTALRSVDGGSAVVTVRSGGHDERRTVQVGLRGDQYTEVRSGLDQGAQVLIAGSR